MARDLDILVYGATGTVGRRVAEHLMDADLKIGVAGRSREKLEDLSRGRAEVLVANSDDDASVVAAVSRAKIVIACAGPFVKMGTPVVEACASEGVHYVDITGETYWAGEMIARFQDRARKNGAVIVPFSGYDSVPSDLGAWLVARALREIHDEGTARAVSIMSGKGGVNGGTAQSALAMFEDPARIAQMDDPFVLCPDLDVDEAARAARVDDGRAVDDPDGVLRAPFFMARINSRVVYRSAALLDYGADFFYDELADLGKRAAGLKARAVTTGAALFAASMKRPTLRKWIGNAFPDAGVSPSEKSIQEGFARATFVGVGEGGSEVRARFFAKGDPANAVTATCVISSAMCLLDDEDREGGFWTPASAFGERLVEELVSRGVTFELTAS